MNDKINTLPKVYVHLGTSGVEVGSDLYVFAVVHEEDNAINVHEDRYKAMSKDSIQKLYTEVLAGKHVIVYNAAWFNRMILKHLKVTKFTISCCMMEYAVFAQQDYDGEGFKWLTFAEALKHAEIDMTIDRPIDKARATKALWYHMQALR